MNVFISGKINNQNHKNDENEMWFTITTIAVPVVGLIILILLVTFAIRMLKADGDNVGNRTLKHAITSSNGGIQAPNSNSNRITTSHLARHLDRNIDYGRNLINNHQIPLLAKTNCLRGTNATIRQHLQRLQEEHQLQEQRTTSFSIVPEPSVLPRPSFPTRDGIKHIISCDKKNEVQAKRNDLINLKYSLLPQSSNDPNIKLTNTEDGVVNNRYDKNVNIVEPFAAPSFAPHTTMQIGFGNSVLPSNHNKYFTNDNKTNKIYEKKVLNPVIANWNL